MFTLAHLSDIHLTPLPKPAARELTGKRFLGYLNWVFNRNTVHSREILDRIVGDMKAQVPDHIAVGGDLINLALGGEFTNARDWLDTLGPPGRVSVIPGNHDTYVKVRREKGIGRWDPYMRTDARGTEALAPGADGFPFVRLYGDIAVVGLSTAVPAPLFMAWGQLGRAQREALERILAALREQGRFRVVLIHHPPLPGATGWGRHLRDAEEMRDILMRHAPELVLHGHNHVQEVDVLSGDTGPVPIVGVPSASSGGAILDRLARYNLFQIGRGNGGWRCTMISRGLRESGGGIEELDRQVLTG